MGIYFGTDGIRGVVNEFLTADLAFKCGNAVAEKGQKIVIGGDTRTTREFLTSSFSSGVMSAGANIVDIGVCTTPGISYITKTLKMDYGVVVSASHNPPQYNGIKIFDSTGVKLGDDREDALERKFVRQKHNAFPDIGRYSQKFSFVRLYENYLVSVADCNLKGFKILLDCANGASYKIAPRVFRELGAEVIAVHCKNDGEKINQKCGSTCPEEMARLVKKYGADAGFSFDGDADRIIACDENGEIIDGDVIIFMLAKYLKQQGMLRDNKVVGTRHTNKGLEEDLKNEGINLIRTDIGDKYVIAKMEEENLSLGGEKSGHIIFRDYASTGDGILTGIKLAEMLKKSGKKLSELSLVHLYPQANIDCIVTDKMKIINNGLLTSKIEEVEKALGDSARVMVRVSGTEPKIRIMVECKDEDVALKCAKEIENVVHSVDRGQN